MGLGGLVHAIEAGALWLWGWELEGGWEFVVPGRIVLLSVVEASGLLEFGRRVEITQWLRRARMQRDFIGPVGQWNLRHVRKIPASKNLALPKRPILAPPIGTRSTFLHRLPRENLIDITYPIVTLFLKSRSLLTIDIPYDLHQINLLIVLAFQCPGDSLEVLGQEFIINRPALFAKISLYRIYCPVIEPQPKPEFSPERFLQAGFLVFLGFEFQFIS